MIPDTKFGSMRRMNSAPTEGESSKKQSGKDGLFGQARRQSLRENTIALFENPSEQLLLDDQLLLGGSSSIIDGDNTNNWLLMPVHEKCQNWIRSFQGLDPRHQILEFFNDLALEGVDKFEKQGSELSGEQKDKPKILKAFVRNGIFTVWRPTSNDAIRKMITGEGTGKGLDIKGKSAKCGAFSGYVPFLQIHENEHKSKISQMRLHERVRVFYPNKASRDIAATELNMLNTDMLVEASSSKADGGSSSTSGGGAKSKWSKLSKKLLDENAMATIASNHALMNPQVFKIDDYVESQSVYGLDIPEQLFWEGYVTPNDITRPKGSKYETGRPSMPEFQQMNIDTLRHWEPCDTDPSPRPVLWHGDCGRIGEDAPEEYNPMCPRGLLMAYEENENVIPVVSDFDCFLLGTRGVRYTEPLGEQEHTMLSQCVDDIEGILETPKEGSNWTQRWLGVKKQHAMEMSEDEPSQEMPKFGYADPRSYKVMTGAVNRLKSNGAVRHGPECFNYGFPQDLDDQYLVVSDTFWGVPWRYVNSDGLIEILSSKVEEGFTFPLNPKWVLCDQGWKKVYDKLLSSEKDNTLDARMKANMVSSMAIWYPDTIRKRIEEISTKYPGGFVDTCVGDQSSGVQTDLAMLELKKYQNQVVAEKKMQRLLIKQKGSRRNIAIEMESKATEDLQQTIEEGTTKNRIRIFPNSRRRSKDESVNSSPFPRLSNWSTDLNTRGNEGNEGDSSATSRKPRRSFGFIKRVSGGSRNGAEESSEATTGRPRSRSRLLSFRLALHGRVSV